MAMARDLPEVFNEPESGPPMIPPSSIPIIRIPDRQSAAMQLVNNLIENVNHSTAYVILKQFEDVIKLALELEKERAITALDGKAEEILGAKVVLKSSKKYDYQNDQLLESLEEQAKAISERIKAHKKFLESLKSEMADTESGEIFKPAKLISDGCTIAVTLPK